MKSAPVSHGKKWNMYILQVKVFGCIVGFVKKLITGVIGCLVPAVVLQFVLGQIALQGIWAPVPGRPTWSTILIRYDLE